VHLCQVKYLKLWNPDLVIQYYTSIYTPTADPIARYNFLQKKIAIFLGFFFMLRPFEAYQATINRNKKNNENSQLGYCLVTNLKNKKLLLSNIWIPNLLFTDNKNNLPVPTTEHQGNDLIMLNLAESIMNPNKSYLLSTFHVIQEFLTLIPKNSNSLFVIQNTKDKMSLSAYRKLIRQVMPDIGIDESYGPYSLKHTAISKLFSLGLELAQVNRVARYALNSTMALAHYNPTSTNKKALHLLSSTNTMEIQPIHSEKKPIYEEPLITQEEDDFKTVFGDDQEIEKIVEEIQEKNRKRKKIMI
jgi:hypothetical protein